MRDGRLGRRDGVRVLRWVLRWVLAAVVLGVLGGFVGGLLRRHAQTPGGVTYVPPEPAADAHVAPPYRPRPTAPPPAGPARD